jgi:hypothetical protein
MFYLPPAIATALAQLKIYEPVAGSGMFILRALAPDLLLSNPPFCAKNTDV